MNKIIKEQVLLAKAIFGIIADEYGKLYPQHFAIEEVVYYPGLSENNYVAYAICDKSKIGKYEKHKGPLAHDINKNILIANGRVEVYRCNMGTVYYSLPYISGNYGIRGVFLYEILDG